MHRLGLRALLLSQRLVLLLVPSLVLAACPIEQVDTSASAGPMTGTSATTAELTGVVAPTTGGTSTGSSGVPTEASSTSSTSSTSTGEVTSGETGASSSSSTGDAGLSETGEGTTGAPPVWTDCFDCLCDINVSFCRKVFAGAQSAVEGPPVECSIVEAEGLESGCVLYPERCGEAPGCDCLPTMDGGCFCNQISPGNFQVTCPLP